MNILIVMLGCSVSTLLDDRINSGVNFALNEGKDNNIDWFLSGGIKNPNESSLSEAFKMSEKIQNSHQFSYGFNKKWNYILDETSTNTAENFINLKKLLKNNPEKYSEIFIVTSDFHFNRAEKFADKIIENNNFKWILSDLELHDSRYWEKIHIRNVDSDVKKANEKFRK